MYVAVDMKALRFLPFGHPNVTALTNLVWLECDVEDEIWMFDIYDHNAFRSFSAYQMSKLYCNTVGADKAPRFGEPLARLLLELATRVPNSLHVQPVRLSMQCDKLSEDDAGKYLYDPVGYSAVRKPDLWEKPTPVLLCPATCESTVAAANRPARPAQPLPAPVQPVTTPAASSAAPGPTSGISQPWLAKPATTTPATGAVAAGIKKPWEK